MAGWFQLSAQSTRAYVRAALGMTAHGMCVCCSWFEGRRRRAAEVQRVADMERAGFMYQPLCALIELQQDPFSITVTYTCCAVLCCAVLFVLCRQAAAQPVGLLVPPAACAPSVCRGRVKQVWHAAARAAYGSIWHHLVSARNTCAWIRHGLAWLRRNAQTKDP